MTEETLEEIRQDRDAYKQAYENICVFYKQLVLANQRLAASHEAVEHTLAHGQGLEFCPGHVAPVVNGYCFDCGLPRRPAGKA